MIVSEVCLSLYTRVLNMTGTIIMYILSKRTGVCLELLVPDNCVHFHLEL